MDISSFDKAIVIFYFLGMIAIGAALTRRIRSFDQFVIAGRQLSAPLLICTLVSTYYGLGVLLAGSEISYESGVVNWFFDTAPAYLAALFTGLVLTKKIRRHDVRSIPDIIYAHYGLSARIFTALASFVYALPAFSIIGIGGLFHALFGIPFEWGLIYGSVIALCYTLLGGLLAVALTDAVQFLLMASTLAIAAIIGLSHIGGVSEMQRLLPDHFHPTGGRPIALLFVYGMTSLSVLIEPAFYQRIFAARTHRDVVIALSAGVLIWMSYDWVITMLGIGAHTAVEKGIIAAPEQPDQAVSRFVLHMLPTGLKGLFAAGLMAAAMSTIDSYLLICASNITYDIYQPLAKNKLSDRSLLIWTRVAMLLATIATILLCLYFRNVERLWIFITAILICTALVPTLAAYYWPNVKRRAGQMSTTVGFTLVICYYAWVDILGTWDADEYAYIWQGDLLGYSLTLNQDYGILYIMPIVMLTFLIAQYLPGDSK